MTVPSNEIRVRQEIADRIAEASKRRLAARARAGRRGRTRPNAAEQLG